MSRRSIIMIATTCVAIALTALIVVFPYLQERRSHAN